MKTIHTFVVFTAVSAGAWAQHAGHATPYAGLQAREIKALSAEDTQALLQGQGMRLALAAELNGYPGPLHVLEHADALQLTPVQRTRAQALLGRHKAEARELGARLVAAEGDLDRLFAGGQASAGEVRGQTARIGQLQAELRAAHLQTHLEQTALLTPQQIAHYQRLRGYGAAHAELQHSHQGEHR
jgi:Spy/CpxP family protein refolding chaperone